jgi:hypothetical protein
MLRTTNSIRPIDSGGATEPQMNQLLNQAERSSEKSPSSSSVTQVIISTTELNLPPVNLIALN